MHYANPTERLLTANRIRAGHRPASHGALDGVWKRSAHPCFGGYLPVSLACTGFAGRMWCDAPHDRQCRAGWLGMHQQWQGYRGKCARLTACLL